jgi:hypothetical protein
MDSLKGDGSDNIETTALLFQTGYLTIKKEEMDNYISQYRIDFPNYEVRSSFLNSLMKEYLRRESEEINGLNKKLEKSLREKSSEDLAKSVRELFSNIPYDLTTEKESYYHSLFLIAARLSGYEVEGEVHTDKGRIDAVLKKEKDIIVVEVKYSKEKITSQMIEEAFGENKEIDCKFREEMLK